MDIWGDIEQEEEPVHEEDTRNKRSRTEHKIPVIAVFTMDPSCAIGLGTGLPWKLPPPVERDQFVHRMMTTKRDENKKNAIIVGKNMFSRFPKDPSAGLNSPTRKLMPNILTCVLSKGLSLNSYDENAPIITNTTVKELLADIQQKQDEIERIFVLGGAETLASTYKFWDEAYVMIYTGSTINHYDYSIDFNPDDFILKERDTRELAPFLTCYHFVKEND